MSLERYKVNYSGNERVDKIDFLESFSRMQKDFNCFIASYIDSEVKRVVREYQQGTHSGLNFRIKLDAARGFHDADNEFVYHGAEAPGSIFNLVLTANATNYIQVNVAKTLAEIQTRAFFNLDLGLNGEEVFDDINVKEFVEENITVNQSAFLAGSLPLFEVSTDATDITSVTNSQDKLWKRRSFSLGSNPLTREQVYSSINDLRLLIDFYGAVIGETKGTGSNIEDLPWSSIKMLKEYQGLFVNSTGNISFEDLGASDKLKWTAALKIIIPGRASEYTVDAAEVTITNGQAVWVSIPEGAPSGSLTTNITAMSAVPIDPKNGSYQANILILFLRHNGTILGNMEIPDLSSGEVAVVGLDLPNKIRQMLGIASETTMKTLASTHIIEDTDDYADRFAKLDDAMNTILNGKSDEEHFVGDGVTTVFQATKFAFINDNTTYDIYAWVAGRRMQLDETGGLTKAWRKISTTEIEFSEAPGDGVDVCIEKPGSVSGGLFAPEADGKIWSDPVDSHVIPSATDLRDAGAADKRFRNGYFKTVYADEVINTQSAKAVKGTKMMMNTTGSPIAAFTPVAKHSSGSIYPADTDAVTGQKYIGITLAAIAHNAAGPIKTVGDNIPDCILGLGFTPGQDIFLGEDGGYTNDITGFTGDNDTILKVGIADCEEGTASGTAKDLIMWTEVISRPVS